MATSIESFAGVSCDSTISAPELSSVYGSALYESVAGDCAHITAISYDTCGALSSADTDIWELHIMGPLDRTNSVIKIAGVPSGNGVYSLPYTITLVGKYNLRVTLNGYVVSDTPLVVYPAAIDLNNTIISSDESLEFDVYGLSTTSAGVPTHLFVQTRDQYGNVVDPGGESEWELSLEGPLSLWQNGSAGVVYIGQGLYAIQYQVPVAGQYALTLKLCGKTLCSPEIGCKFCVDVEDDESFYGGYNLTYVTIPDAPELAMSEPFSLSAWVKPDAALISNMTWLPEDMIVVSKRSEKSGQGHSLGLRFVEQDVYNITASYYVGNATFRSLNATVEITSWSHIAATYDGSTISIYDDGVEIAFQPYAVSKMPRQNSQPLVIGKDFIGSIDDVRVYSSAVNFSDSTSASYCPAKVSGMGTPWDDHLVAYYRLNEGYGYQVLDSSGSALDGLIGAQCRQVMENETFSLSCAPGFQIGDVMFANYGVTDGQCGQYVSTECTFSNSTSIIEEMCKGAPSCSFTLSSSFTTPSGLSFGTPCQLPKTLTAQVICIPDENSTAIASTMHWTGYGAPNGVGSHFTAVLSRPESTDFPSSFTFPEGLIPTDGELVDLVAGSLYGFQISTLDYCGYTAQHGHQQAVNISLYYPEFISQTVLLGNDSSVCYPTMTNSSRLEGVAKWAGESKDQQCQVSGP